MLGAGHFFEIVVEKRPEKFADLLRRVSIDEKPLFLEKTFFTSQIFASIFIGFIEPLDPLIPERNNAATLVWLLHPDWRGCIQCIEDKAEC